MRAVYGNTDKRDINSIIHDRSWGSPSKDTARYTTLFTVVIFSLSIIRTSLAQAGSLDKERILRLFDLNESESILSYMDLVVDLSIGGIDGFRSNPTIPAPGTR